jgi:hypothetical protein
MLKRKEDKKYYYRNFELAISLSLFLIIILFLLSPQKIPTNKIIPLFPEQIVTITDIPFTNPQSNNLEMPPQKPQITAHLMPIEDPSLLPDIEVMESGSENNNEARIDLLNKSSNNKKEIYEASSFPFVPRQIIEVLPEKIDGAEGEIKLKLLIGRNGYLKDYILIINTTKEEKCLKAVLDAIYKSRWQPVMFDDEKIEYWIEKSYSYN